MKINWTVRFKNKEFWITFIPAFLLFIQALASVFGYAFDFGELGNRLLNVIEALFMVLALLGVVTDHTTEGLSDSRLALTYNKPKRD